jgi:uncharacterized membrane protein
VREQAAEATIAGIAQKVGLSGGATAAIGGLTANEIAAFGGLLVAVVGLAIQWYYKRKADRRDAELHAERMRELRE